MRLSIKKTVIHVCPKSTIILGWIWFAGTLRASLHPTYMYGLRSFSVAYKVLNRVLPGYLGHLHPLEQATAGPQSKDHILWNGDLKVSFKTVQTALRNTKAITLPRPDDMLCGL